MMTILRCICFVTFFSAECSILAQSDSMSKKQNLPGHILFSAGVSEPMSTNIATGELYDPLTYSKGGITYQLGMYKNFSKYFEAVFSVHYEDFNYDEALLESTLNTKLQSGYVATGIEVFSKRMVAGIQLGVNSIIPVFAEGRFCFEPGIQLGLSRVWTSEFSAGYANESTPQTPVYTGTYNAAKSGNLVPTVSFDLGFRYSLKNRICFTIQAEYYKFLSEVNYNLVITHLSGDTTTTPVSESAGWGYTSIRLGLGWLILK